MSNEKTVWNNSLFSDRYKTQNNSDENFQTMNMIYKIKKIKKQKKNKKLIFENYKGIEPLKNINEIEEETNEDQSKNVNNNVVIEGLEGHVSTDDPNFLGLPDEYFDGVDTPSSGDKSTDPRVILSNFIDKIFKKIDKFNYDKAYLFARAFSGTKPEYSDVLVVKKYIGWFETVLLSYFACYNWFFLMYYRYNHNDNVESELLGHRYKTPILDTYDFQNKSFNRIDFWGMIYKFINYFFIYCLMFVEYLQNIMMEKIPNICKIVFNLKGCFIFIFILMIYFIQYWSQWLFKFLKDILKGNTNNIIIGIMYFILILGYFFGTYNFGYVVKTPGYTFHSFADFFMGLPFSLVTAFLRFIFIMLTSVPIGGVLCVFYILYQSFFGILFNVGIAEFFGATINQKNIFEKINEFIKDNNESKKSFVKNGLNFAMDRFLYSNILSIGCMTVFIFAMADYLKPKFIKNDNLRFNMITVTISFILFLLYIMSRQIYLDFNDNINPIPTSEKNDQTLSMFAEITRLASELAKEILKPIIEKQIN